MRLVIDRNTWARGGVWGSGRTCALGQMEMLLGRREYLYWLDGVREVSDEVCVWIIAANDAHCPEPERERKLTDLFGKLGVDVEYIG